MPFLKAYPDSSERLFLFSVSDVQRPVQWQAVQLYVQASVLVLKSRAYPDPDALTVTALYYGVNFFQSFPLLSPISRVLFAVILSGTY